MEHGDLTQKIIGCAMKVHRILGPGFLESVYQNALAYELHKAGIAAECERKIQVYYDGVVVGDFAADMFVEGCVLIENKAVRALVLAHEVQLVNYLTATRIDVGLLFNFGSRSLEYKRKLRTFRPAEDVFGQDLQDLQDGSA
jgi:GxxExxY protein